MRITYDKIADAAYIYFTEIKPGAIKKTYACDPVETGMINIDFDKNRVLVGIEILGASVKLPKEILEQAEIIG